MEGRKFLTRQSKKLKPKSKPPSISHVLEPGELLNKHGFRKKTALRASKTPANEQSKEGLPFPTHSLAPLLNRKPREEQLPAGTTCLVGCFKSSGQHCLPVNSHPASAAHLRSSPGRDTSRLILSFGATHLARQLGRSAKDSPAR